MALNNGKRYQCFVDICTMGLHFCHTGRNQQRCALCSDYSSYCFTSNHQKNCTNFCKELLLKSLKMLQTTSTEVITVQSTTEDSDDTHTDIFLWFFVAFLTLVFVTSIITISCYRWKDCIKQTLQAAIRRAHLCFTVMVYGQAPTQTHHLRDTGSRRSEVAEQPDTTQTSSWDMQRSGICSVRVGQSDHGTSPHGTVVNGRRNVGTHQNEDTLLKTIVSRIDHRQGGDERLLTNDTGLKEVTRGHCTVGQQNRRISTRYSGDGDSEALQPLIQGDLFCGKGGAPWNCSTLNIDSLLSGHSNEIQTLSTSVTTNTKVSLYSPGQHVRCETCSTLSAPT